jgi:peroxiredoxin
MFAIRATRVIRPSQVFVPKSLTRNASSQKSLREGDAIPNVVFKTRVRDESIGGSNPFKWKDVSTNELFAKNRVVLFALPGAFTPTCSSTHLPGYDKHYGKPS